MSKYETNFLIFFLILNFLCITSANIIPKNEEENAEPTVEEVHHATCSISSDDVAATANATITRQLRGICTSAHLDNRIDTLQKMLIRELDDLKKMLLFRSEPSKSRQEIKSNEINYKNNPTDKFSLKNLNSRPFDSNLESSELESEIQEKNMTISKDENGITFLYYWKIENIIDVIGSKEIIQSGDFHFAGHHLYIRLIPQLFNSKNLYVQVIGLGFFNLAHQFSILSQSNIEFDIFSPIFINCASAELNVDIYECEGFEISKDLLITKNLIKGNKLILKVLIYL